MAISSSEEKQENIDIDFDEKFQQEISK